MSKIYYKKQSVSGLEYKLFLASDLDYKFNILKNRVVDWQGVMFDFYIIGSSHFVKINTGKADKLIELLACIESKDTAAGMVVQQNKLADHYYRYSRRFDDSYKYSFYSEAIKGCAANSKEFRNKYIDNSCKIYLEYIFPSSKDLAVTSIEIHRGIDKFSWVTHHSYPEEKVIIKTRSIVERRGGY